MKAFKYVITMAAVLMLMLILFFSIGRIIKTRQLRISAANGIAEGLYLDIGGVKQYVHIRGQDKDNPLLLVLHGGPGSPMNFIAHYWQAGLEDDFTVVQWDQRGCGRTYYATQTPPLVEATREILLADLDEIVNYLTERFEQNEIIILGHSWGTVLGARYAQEHPDKVSAYVAVAQIVDSLSGEYVAAQEAIQLAMNVGDESTAKAILRAYEEFTEDDFDIEKLVSLRSLTARHLPSGDNISSLKQIWMGAISPQMGVTDLKWYLYPMIDLKGFSQVNLALFKDIFESPGFNLYNCSSAYDVPVCFISGDKDWVAPYTMVEDYFESIIAPDKSMVFIKNAGHTPFLDKPIDFCEAVKSALLP